MPKVTLPIALLVLGVLRLPGEHELSEAEAQHAHEQLERLGQSTPSPDPATPSPPPSLEDTLAVLQQHLAHGEITSEALLERLGISLPAPPTPATVQEASPPPAGTIPQAIPPALVREMKKVGLDLTKPETIHTADDEALLAVKGMTPALLAAIRAIVG